MPLIGSFSLLSAGARRPGRLTMPIMYEKERASARSNALFEIMFTLPPIESASMSGVGAFVTSIVSTRLSEACSNSNARPVLAEAELAMRSPSIVTEFRSAPMPRMETVRTSIAT